MPGARRKIRKQIALAYSAVFFIFFLDQLSKYLVRELVHQGSSLTLIKNILYITLVYNKGAAFGIFRTLPQLFIIISVLAIILINYLLLRKTLALKFMEKTALCFILSGTLGNLADRIHFGYVVDFIDFRIWPVFNLADSFITVGAVILGLSIFRGARKRQGKDA